MKPFFAASWINAEIIQALCWTLLHSLWQGLLVAVIAGAILMITRKSSAALRYNLLSALIVLFIGVVAMTFVKQLQLAAHDIITDRFILSATVIQSTENGTSVTILPGTFMGSLIAFFDRYSMWIVTAWFIVLTIKFIRMLIGFAYMHRIRNYKTHPVEQQWLDKLAILKANLKISKTVGLMESELVTVPLVIGFLKPFILVPLGFFANIPPTQVEHILLHELAHIRRKDYVINILQSLIEIVFFFNPAVLWINTLIREERENCCDDLAISGVTDKMFYVKSLISFQEYNLNLPSSSALGFAGSRYPMLNRIRRIVSNNNKNLNVMERIFLVSSIVLIIAIALLSRNSAQAQTTTKDIKVNRVFATEEGKKFTRLVEAQDDKGAKYKIISVNKVITEFYINDKKIPVDQVFEYKDIVQKIDDQITRQQELEDRQAIEKEKKDQEGWNKARAEGLRQDSIERANRKASDEKDARDWENARQAGIEAQRAEKEKSRLYEEVLGKIADDLVKDRIVESAAKLISFTLGKGELVVNDQKQPFDIYNRYKARYIKSSEEQYRYNHK
jgi:bla regulator protein blaR1